MAVLAGCLCNTVSLTRHATSGTRRPLRVAPQCAAIQTPVRTAASQQVRLGSSDLLVTECCLGTMTWGNQNTEAEAHEQLGYALEQGVNFLDTAEMYPVPPKKELQGRTDRYIGTWMKNRQRDSIVLASKVSGYGERSSYLRDNADCCRVTPEQIEEGVNKGLQRLQTDYIDLLQVHWPDRYVPLFGQGGYDFASVRDAVPFEEQLRGLENVIKAGKVRYIGVSNETSFGVMSFLQAAQSAGLPRIVSIQNSYSLLVRVPFETDLVEVCAPHHGNVGLLAYSPLAGGALTGKYIKGQSQNARFNLFPGYMARYNKSYAREAVGEYAKVAEKHGLTPTQLALAWCKSRSFVTSTIIGATSMEQLKENIGAFEVELSEEALQDIDLIYKKYRDPTMM